MKFDKKGFAFSFLLINIVFLSFYRWLIWVDQSEDVKIMENSMLKMTEYSSVIKDYRLGLGIPLDKNIDPNLTGLIGEDYNEITTTMGHLQSKRTSTNPNMAALMVSFFQQLELTAGDNVAIGSSGSFPALLFATIAACEAMNLNPVTIISAGASQFGANIPQLTLVHMIKHLEEKGYKSFHPAAVSMGGDEDIGLGLMEGGLEILKDVVFNSGYDVIYQEDFEKNVEERMKIYGSAGNMKAFVNIGGALTNTGKGTQILDLKPGFNEITEFPDRQQTGVIFEMAKSGVPTIHLLYMKGISMQFGIDFDPIPLPSSLDADLKNDRTKSAPKIKLLILLYFASIIAFLVFHIRKNSFRKK